MANAMTEYPGFKLGGCIFGKPTAHHKGYVAANYKGKSMGKHRVVWIKTFGEIPDGMIVDHACHTEAMLNGLCKGGATCIHRSCLNPEHLQLITFAENVRDGSSSFRNRTHCMNGLHELTEENLGKSKTQNYCKACFRESSRLGQARTRAKKKAGVL